MFGMVLQKIDFNFIKSFRHVCVKTSKSDGNKSFQRLYTALPRLTPQEVYLCLILFFLLYYLYILLYFFYIFICLYIYKINKNIIVYIYISSFYILLYILYIFYIYTLYMLLCYRSQMFCKLMNTPKNSLV